jgi:hypothetical protein
MKQHFGHPRFRKLRWVELFATSPPISSSDDIKLWVFRCYPLRTFQQRLKFRANI